MWVEIIAFSRFFFFFFVSAHSHTTVRAHLLCSFVSVLMLGIVLLATL